MLNPSTADEAQNDPTVERCERRARSTAGIGGLEVINIFAFRETDPEVMKLQPDPIGPDNNRHIIEAAKKALMVICAWGKHGQHLGRGKEVLTLLTKEHIQPYCLKVNKDGYPTHPLYVGYHVKPIKFTSP